MKRHRRMDESNAGGGFTLIEVLTACMIFAVVVGALSSAFYGAITLREKAYITFEREPVRTYLLTRIKQDLASCVAPSGVLAGPMLGTPEESNQERLDRLEFYSATGITDPYHPWGDLQKIEYELLEPIGGESESGRIFTRTVTRNLLALTEEEPETDRLIDGVQSLEFSYYDGETWTENWDSTAQENELPEAVLVRLVLVSSPDEEASNKPIEIIVPTVMKAVPTPVSGSEAAGTGSLESGNPSGNSGTNSNPNTNPTGGQPGGGRS